LGEGQAFVGIDRKDWTPNIDEVSESYMLDFNIPDAPPIECLKIESVTFSVNNFNVDFNNIMPPECFLFYFINILECDSNSPLSCPTSSLLYEGINNPDGFSITIQSGNNDNDIEFYAGMPLGFDITVVSDANNPPCDLESISNGSFSANFEVCCTVTYSPDEPENPLELPDDIFICVGQDVTLEGPDGYAQYEWFGPINSQDQNIPNAEAGGYTLQVFDDNGCQSQDDIAIIESQPDFSIQFNQPDPYIVCNESPEFLNISLINGNGIYFYDWIDPDNMAQTSNLLLPTSSGTYYITVTEDDTNCQVIDSIEVNLVELSTAQIDSLAPLTTIMCQDGSISLKAFIPFTDNNVYTYEWVFGGDTVRTAINTITTPGTYVLNLYNNLGCPSSSDTITVNQVSPNIAGQDNLQNICGVTLIDLDTLLSVDASNVGNWVDIDNSGNLAGSIYDLSSSSGQIDFLYIVENAFPCENDTAEVSIIVEGGNFQFECPSDAIVECFDDISTGQVNFFGGGGTVTNTTMPTLVSGTEFCMGAIYEIKYEVFGECGEIDSCFQTFEITSTIIDLACPDDVIVECISDFDPDIINPSVTTNCQTPFNINIDGPNLINGLENCSGAEYITTYIGSTCNVSSSCDQTITIQNSAPTIQCAENRIIIDESEVIAEEPTILSSACAITTSISSEAPILVSPATTCDGAVYEILYVVTDDCGQSTTCTQLFTTEAMGPFAGFDFEEDYCSNTEIDLSNLISGDPDGCFINDAGDKIPSSILNTNNLNLGSNLIQYIVEAAGCGTDTSDFILNVADVITFDLEGEFCSDFEIMVGNNLYNSDNTTGQESFSSTNGCDSLVNINLTISDPIVNTIGPQVCGDTSIIVNNIEYNQSNPFGTEILTSQEGCDSTVFIDINFLEASETNLDLSPCEGDSVFVAGQWVFISDDFSETLINSVGCDSIVNTSIVFVNCNVDLITNTEEPLCSNGTDGSIEFTIGGTISEPYAYELEDEFNNIIESGTISDGQSIIISGLSGGTYVLVLSDGVSGDVISQTTLPVISPDVLMISNSIVQELECFGDNNAIVMLDANGGTGQLEYVWNGVSSAQTINDLGDGTYTYSVSDVNGCTATGSVTIIQPTPLSFSFDVIDADCGQSNGSFSINDVQGGTPPYMFGLENGTLVSSNNFENLSAGEYNGVIEHGNGCITSWTITVEDSGDLELAPIADQNITLGDSYSLTIPNNSTSSLTVNWTPDENISCTDCLNPIFTPTETTTYTITAVDENGCMDVQSFTINTVEVLEEEFVYMPNIFSLNANNPSNQIIGPLTSSNTTVQFIDFSIYDRWGNLVHFEESVVNGWDGFINNSKAQSGVYVFQLNYITAGIARNMNGQITLTR